MLSAGRDTTAILFANLVFFVPQKPEIWRKLKHEVQDTLCGNLPTVGRIWEKCFHDAILGLKKEMSGKNDNN